MGEFTIPPTFKVNDMSNDYERFKKMVEASQDWFWEFDENANFSYISPSIRDLLGYEPEELIGLNAFDLMAPDEAELVRSHFDPIAKRYLPFSNLVNINIHKDGHEVVIESNGTPIFDGEGHFRGYRGVDRDITQRRKVEDELRKSKERLQNIFENSSEWIWEIDLSGNHTYSNDRLLDLLGYSPEEFVGKECTDFLHQDDSLKVKETLPQLTSEKRGWNGWVLRWRHKDGSYRYLESNAKPIFDADDEVVGYCGADRDITDRKLAEDALRKSQKRFQDVTAQSPLSIVVTGAKGDIEFFNNKFIEVFGYTLEDISTAEQWWLAAYPDETYRQKVQESWAKAIDKASEKGTQIESQEWKVTCKDGSVRSVEFNMMPLDDISVVVMNDITDRKKTDENLKKSERLFRDFFESNPIATIITSPSGTVHLINSAFSKGSGFSAEEVIGHTSQELGFWRDPTTRELVVSAIMEHGFIDNLETIFYCKGDLPMTGLVCSRAIEHEGEVRMLSTVVDVTAQREAEKALRKLDQAKSDFIATAAHELRTPLVAILGFAEILESTDQPRISAQQQQSYSSIIRSNADILNRLVDDLLDVEQIQLKNPFILTLEKSSPAKLINETLASFTLNYPDHRFILTHTEPLPESMWVDSVRATQVLNNLLDNAVKYSPEGRIVEITTETDENQVKISIKDQGVGMTSEEIEQIFHRFYRANPMNAVTQGLGLGMCIVKRIIEDHGGEICVTSRPGEGTTVTFTLPIKRIAGTESR